MYPRRFKVPIFWLWLVFLVRVKLRLKGGNRVLSVFKKSAAIGVPEYLQGLLATQRKTISESKIGVTLELVCVDIMLLLMCGIVICCSRKITKQQVSESHNNQRETERERERGNGSFTWSDVPFKDRGHTILCFVQQVRSRRGLHHFCQELKVFFSSLINVLSKYGVSLIIYRIDGHFFLRITFLIRKSSYKRFHANKDGGFCVQTKFLNMDTAYFVIHS